MANISRYKFTLEELASLLIKKAEITDGFWTIGVDFKIVVANAGQDKDNVRPSALISADQITLSKATKSGPLTFDAAKIMADGK